MPEKVLRRFLVVDRLKLIYCALPKVASTNWRRRLAELSSGQKLDWRKINPLAIDTENFMEKHGVKNFRRYTNEEIKQRLNDYFKILFVRHPIERMLSAYRDKLGESAWEHPTDFAWHKAYNQFILTKYRKDHEIVKTGTEILVAPWEFVSALIDESNNGRVQDVHWDPMHPVIFPCFISYDFVGKFETLGEDVKYLGELLVQNFQLLSHTRESMVKSVYTDMYNSLTEHLSKEDIAKLWNLYKYDMEIFGYKEYPF